MGEHVSKPHHNADVPNAHIVFMHTGSGLIAVEIFPVIGNGAPDHRENLIQKYCVHLSTGDLCICKASLASHSAEVLY